MRHDIRMGGLAFRLRPVGDADAAFIVRLRSDPSLNRFVHASSPRVEDQQAWLARYYDRPDDYYFLIETMSTGDPEGVISLYDVDVQRIRGEWGRWILRPGSLAAVESAWLIYRVAFDELGLHSVYCRTVAANEAVVSFHESCGIDDRRVLRDHFELGGQRLDAIEHRVDRGAWGDLEPRLSRLAWLMAGRLTRG